MKRIIAIMPIIFLILFTTYIKGTTKKIEKEIFNKGGIKSFTK